MKIIKVDHIGIAVNSIDIGKSFWSDILGFPFEGDETVAEQKVRTAFFPVGESEVELLESTAPDGPISKYIEKKGEGIQHVAFRVKDIDSALSELKQKGIRKDGNLIFTDDMSKVPEDQQAGVKVPDAFDLTPVTPGGGI